mmetsp:Transcript_30425/g.93464  ORF Transcript_30425/g.93464 Transcript_30425/m.93464 type:complete len:213 (+) Transcript_30425:978-1616(+)
MAQPRQCGQSHSSSSSSSPCCSPSSSSSSSESSGCAMRTFDAPPSSFSVPVLCMTSCTSMSARPSRMETAFDGGCCCSLAVSSEQRRGLPGKTQLSRILWLPRLDDLDSHPAWRDSPVDMAWTRLPRSWEALGTTGVRTEGVFRMPGLELSDVGSGEGSCARCEPRRLASAASCDAHRLTWQSANCDPRRLPWQSVSCASIASSRSKLATMA